jgi:hypothetical protein
LELRSVFASFTDVCGDGDGNGSGLKRRIGTLKVGSDQPTWTLGLSFAFGSGAGLGHPLLEPESTYQHSRHRNIEEFYVCKAAN